MNFNSTTPIKEHHHGSRPYMNIIYSTNGISLASNYKHLNFDINSDINIKEIKIKFNHEISRLSILNSSNVPYWLMRISERNTMNNDLFLDICYIFLIKEYSNKYKELVVSTDRTSIFLFFNKIADVNISMVDRFYFNLSVLKGRVVQFLQVFKFIVNQLYVFLLVNILHFDKKKDLSGSVIIQTWIADANLKDNFIDTYFYDLHDYLKQSGLKVLTFPVFYNIKNIHKTLKYIKSRDNDFVVLEQFLTIKDYYCSILHLFKKRNVNFDNVVIEGISFSKVFDYYKAFERVEESSLFYFWVKNVSLKGNKNIRFFLNHENMVIEKAMILAGQRYGCKYKFIGVFHTTKPRNLLCLEYSSLDEYQISPKPDVIMFNSNNYLEYYKKMYPSMLCRSGFAFKQAYLASGNNECIVSGKSDKTILVLLPGSMENINLIFSFLNAYRYIEEYKIIFRMHPMNVVDINQYYPFNNYVVDAMNLSDTMKKVDKVISAYSATLIEAALFGKDVGFVYDKQKLLLNPFDDLGMYNYTLIHSNETMNEFILKKNVSYENKSIFNTDKRYMSVYLDEVVV